MARTVGVAGGEANRDSEIFAESVENLAEAVTFVGGSPHRGTPPDSFRLAQIVGFSVSSRGRNVYMHTHPPTVVDLSATKHCHCLAARKRARVITRLYAEKLRPHDLRATQFSVLAALALKGPTPLGELADVLGLERTSLTRTANRMEDDGWLTEAESEDARVRRLKLTSRGRGKIESAYPAWKEA